MTKKKTAETVGKKVTQKALPNGGEEATALAKSTPNAIADTTQTSDKVGTTGLKKTANKIDTRLMAEGSAFLDAADVVGPPTAELKEKFSAQKIPLQTNFADLIDVADCGRKAVGASPVQAGGTGAGLQLDGEDRLAVLSQRDRGISVGADGVGMVVEDGNGLTVGANGIAIKAGVGIKVDDSGVCVDLARVLPIGMIMMFSGSVVPIGWRLCDGTSGTPDLRNRFILGGDAAELNGKSTAIATGGLAAKQSNIVGSSTTPAMSVSIGLTILTEGQIPRHQHIVPPTNYNVGTGNREASFYPYGGVSIPTSIIAWDSNNDTTNTASYKARYSSFIGADEGHKHDGLVSGGAHTHETNVIPPYYILMFIIKVEE